ncbi:MAG: excinuclease ABC subunit C [Deltaproteobacteria bacterium SG8_13]|nr:MAG: excinuclease ABC subunit C [Deltaproteobacteria bacterium SG8_13]
MQTPADNSEYQRITDLHAELPHLPVSAGVYLMRNADGEVIYVGKARNLKKRLGAYVKNAGRADTKTEVLIGKIATVETIVTASEKEALILESNLIKRYRPRYNVDLKDDKRYPSLRLDIGHPFPRLSIVRKIRNDGALYFGPYASAQAVRQTLKIINKNFKIRKCSDREFKTRTRPCLHCQMQGCAAPCCREVDADTYADMVQEVVLFLKGRTPDLLHKIKKDMTAAAEEQDFERAAVLRDRIFALQRTLEKQAVVTTDFTDRDVIATAGNQGLAMVTMLTVRGGFLQGSRSYPINETMSNQAEIISAFIRQYYERASFIPPEILVSAAPDEVALVEDRLRDLKGRRVRLIHPRRGEKAQLLRMAVDNAEKELSEQLAARAAKVDFLQRLSKRLQLSAVPQRIECFDNSNLFGAQPVASMAVFSDGRADKPAYRRYKIRSISVPDDYASMKEVLSRRLGKGAASEPLPNLIMVDGGKGQLGIALAVVSELGLQKRIDLVAIAKRDEKRGEKLDKIFLPQRSNPVQFGRDSDLLLFLQHIRDEAHRFAIDYHRRRRKKRALRSALDSIPGVGPRRKEQLLRRFRSVAKIREATVDELSSLPGISRKLAETIRRSLL